MQLFSRNKALVALSLGALVALGACGDDVTVPAPVSPAETVSISPSNANMNVGETLNFAVQITGGAASATLASCTSSSATVATAAVNAGACRVTAVAAGNVTITATTSTGKSAAAAVAVAAPAPAITGLTVSPSAAQVAVGSSVTLVPSATRANASVNVAYTYTSSATAVATVSSTGVVTAVAPGVATITIAATGSGTGLASASLSTAAAITVSDRTPGLTTLQVSPTTAALLTGGTQQVTATAQGPRASAATITYGTSAPAIATVSASGLITAVAPGTATITVTAQATQDGAFAASSITGLVTVTVTAPAQVTVSLSGITQGPSVTSYTATATSGGIVSANNAQVNLPVDATNVRDQIQVVGTLAANGARVDSVVVYVANADGSNRVAAARQAFANGVAASGNLTFFVNTADFTADFAAGTAAVRFSNGQRQISLSAWSGTTEVRAAATQTLAFNNVDGYAARLTAPRSAISAAGLVWHGGPDSLTASLGSATVVPVFYTAGRTLARATLSMRQGALGDTQVCSTARNNLTAAPFTARFGGAAASAGDTTLVNCSTLESGLDHFIGVTAATDAAGAPAPITTYAAGFRTSASVTAPTALRLDYVAPTATAIDRKPDLPADTSTTWLNRSFSFDTATAPTTDAGVGMPGTTVAQRKANRQWSYLGCGVGSTATSPATYVAFDGSAQSIIECTSNATNSAYTARYTDADALGNRSAAVTGTFGIDNTAPLITWTGTAVADSIDNSNGFAAITIIPNVFDAKTNLDSANVMGYVAKFGAAYYDATPGGRNNWRGCYNLHNAATPFTTTGNIAASTTLTCFAEAYRTSVAGTVAGTVKPLATISTEANANINVFVRVYDDAGNMAEASRRAMHDLAAPTITAGLNSALAAASNPTINGTFRDHRMGTAALTVNYGSSKFRYAPSELGTAFGSLYTPSLAGTIGGSTTSSTTATAFPLTPPTATPFVLGVGTGASGAAYTILSQVGILGTDVAGNAQAEVTDAVQAASVPTLATPTSTTTAGTFTVLTSLNAAGGAAAGPKAQLTGAGLTTPSTYSRVDFYRQNGANTFDYLGSSSTPVTSGDAGANPVYTWLLTSYAPTNPQGTVTRPIAISDVIVALGVKSTGAADMTTAATIGGSAVSFVVAGLPASGTTANFTITGPNGFSQTVSSGNATVTIAVPAQGVYTVTPTTATTAAGVLYTSTNAAGQSITVVGNSVFSLAQPFSYSANLIQVSVTVAGLPAGSTTTLTITQAGQATVTASANGSVAGTVNIVTLPAAGAWTVTPAASVTINRLAYTPSAALSVNAAVQASPVNAGTLTYANTTYHIPVTVTSPDLTTLTPSITSVGGATASWPPALGTTNITYGTTAPSATSVLTANAVTVDGVTYGPVTASTGALTPSLTGAAPNTASFAYHRARLIVQFTGPNLADLNGYSAPVTITGPNGALAPVTMAISSTPSSAMNVPVAGSYTAAAIPSIVIGSSTYSFAVGSATAVYNTAANAATLTIGVTKTTLTAAATGTLTVSGAASSTVLASAGNSAWTNANVATTRTVTPAGLTFDGSATKSWTCAVTTAAFAATNLATATVDQSTGVCTVTGAGIVTGAAINLNVRLAVTAFGATLSTVSQFVDVPFTRDANPAITGTAAASLTGSSTMENNAGAATRTLAISGLAIATPTSGAATVNYVCSSSNTALATVLADQQTGVCTITRAGTVVASTNVTITMSVAASGTGLTTTSAASNQVTQTIVRDIDPNAVLSVTPSANGALANGATRTITPNFAAGAAISGTATCTSSDTEITVTSVSAGGICTLTAAANSPMAPVNVIITYTVSGSGGGNITNSITQTFVILRQ